MSNWQRTLDLSSAWERRDNGTLSLNDLCGIMVKKLKKLRDFKDEDLDSEKEDIIEEFEYLGKSEDPNVKEFDEILAVLYDWADTPLDDKFGGKKVCWIKTF